jgi:ribosomal protein L23
MIDETKNPIAAAFEAIFQGEVTFVEMIKCDKCEALRDPDEFPYCPCDGVSQ